MLTMLIDHVGIVFYDDDWRFRLIGRLALPLYAYALVLGFGRTRNVPRYMLRLAAIAVVLQLPYEWAFGYGGPETGHPVNVVGSLLVCLCVLYALDRLPLPAGVACAAAAGWLLEALSFSYGFYALALVLVLRYGRGHAVLLWHTALNLIFLFYKGWLIQSASVFGTALVVYGMPLLDRLDRASVPRLLWRSFYPLHLALIALAAYGMGL